MPNLFGVIPISLRDMLQERAEEERHQVVVAKALKAQKRRIAAEEKKKLAAEVQRKKERREAEALQVKIEKVRKREQIRKALMESRLREMDRLLAEVQKRAEEITRQRELEFQQPEINAQTKVMVWIEEETEPSPLYGLRYPKEMLIINTLPDQRSGG